MYDLTYRWRLLFEKKYHSQKCQYKKAEVLKTLRCLTAINVFSKLVNEKKIGHRHVAQYINSRGLCPTKGVFKFIEMGAKALKNGIPLEPSRANYRKLGGFLNESEGAKPPAP